MGLRILHTVELYAPSVGGAQEVVRQVSERLVSRGHDVTVATSSVSARGSDEIGGVRIAEFDISGNDVRGMQGEVDRYRRFVIEGRFDVVMMYAAQQWATDALLPVLESIEAPKILAPCGFSGLHQAEFASYFARLRERLNRFDHLIFHSEAYQDIEFARDSGAWRLTVIPNGADEAEFEQLPRPGLFREAHGITADAPLLLTVGGHTGLKGHAQAMAAFRAADATRGATLAIIGNTPTGPGCLNSCRVRAAAVRIGGGRRRVLLARPPRDGTLAAFRDADLFLFCSMVECSPLVLFEAMAAGLPFVSIDVGNAREIAGWSDAGTIVPSRRRADGLREADPADVARSVDDLLGDPHRRREMAHSGRRAWQRSFTWDAVAGRYEGLYLDLAR